MRLLFAKKRHFAKMRHCLFSAPCAILRDMKVAVCTFPVRPLLSRALVLACSLLLSASVSRAAEGQVRRGLRYSEAAGAAGFGDLHYPAKWTAETPVVLTIHGGGWTTNDRRSLAGVAEFFARELGFAAFNVDYRLASKATPWPACGDDCLAAARYLLSPAFPEATGLRPKRIWVVGASSGGHLALWTGLSLPAEQVAGIVSISGIADPGPDRAAHLWRYRFMAGAGLPEMSPMSLVRPNGPRVLLTHATEDAVVPIASARNFEKAYRAAGNEVAFFEYSSAVEPGLTGHFIWRPKSSPHRLVAPLEARIRSFVEKRPASPASPR